MPSPQIRKREQVPALQMREQPLGPPGGTALSVVGLLPVPWRAARTKVLRKSNEQGTSRKSQHCRDDSATRWRCCRQSVSFRFLVAPLAPTFCVNRTSKVRRQESTLSKRQCHPVALPCRQSSLLPVPGRAARTNVLRKSNEQGASPRVNTVETTVPPGGAAVGSQSPSGSWARRSHQRSA